MAKKQTRIIPKRGEVYLVRFDPTVGHEIQKTRPAVVVQNDILNKFSSVTTVAAITSKITDRIYPHQVALGKGEGGTLLNSLVLLDQLRSIDLSRLEKHLGVLDNNTMQKIDEALVLTLGLYR